MLWSEGRDPVETHETNRLLLKTATGDRTAFHALYAATSGKLFAILIRVLGNEADASDVLQEVYITVWKRADRFDPARGNAMCWLAVMTRNAGIDALRRRCPGQIGEEYIDLQTSNEPTPFDNTLTSDTAQNIAKRIEDLPYQQRDAVRLFYLEENSLAEVSEIMAAPLNTVKSWVRRGVANLRKEFDDSSFQEFI